MHHVLAHGWIEIYHVQSAVVNDILRFLEEQYGNLDLITTTKVKKNDYLGRLLDFSEKGKVRLTIPKHIQSIL